MYRKNARDYVDGLLDKIVKDMFSHLAEEQTLQTTGQQILNLEMGRIDQYMLGNKEQHIVEDMNQLNLHDPYMDLINTGDRSMLKAVSDELNTV